MRSTVNDNNNCQLLFIYLTAICPPYVYSPTKESKEVKIKNKFFFSFKLIYYLYLNQHCSAITKIDSHRK